MRRGTTPTNTFTVDVDLRQATALYVTYKQNSRVILEKTLADATITETSVAVTLTQEETLAFGKGTVSIQIRAKFVDGVAIASNIITANVNAILKDGVI